MKDLARWIDPYVCRSGRLPPLCRPCWPAAISGAGCRFRRTAVRVTAWRSCWLVSPAASRSGDAGRVTAVSWRNSIVPRYIPCLTLSALLVTACPAALTSRPTPAVVLQALSATAAPTSTSTDSIGTDTFACRQPGSASKSPASARQSSYQAIVFISMEELLDARRRVSALSHASAVEPESPGTGSRTSRRCPPACPGPRSVHRRRRLPDRDLQSSRPSSHDFEIMFDHHHRVAVIDQCVQPSSNLRTSSKADPSSAHRGYTACVPSHAAPVPLTV